MKAGANHPMGSFELSNLIGLDLYVEIIKNLNASFGGNKFEPSSVLRNLVKNGHW
ncbi:MAG: hypothetical protein JSW00_12745 [Thermoplasmata archaeon]|nr:MAG: hypothetical protein JSW00_12745 [Thermoplasmata archaeon]